MKLSEYIQVGMELEVSIIRGKVIEGKRNLIGKFYPKPGVNTSITAPPFSVTCLSSNKNIFHGDIWRAKVTKVNERSVVVEYIDKLGCWKEY